MIKYSFIIPVFNTKQYLERCVGSVLKQACLDYEILLIDDGSTDGSSELCDRLSFVHPIIKVYHQSNSGVSAARNKGIKHSSGDYLIFIDSDDWISENYLASIEKSIDTSASDILCYHYCVADEWVDHVGTHATVKKIEVKSFLKSRHFSPALWSYVFKRSILLDFGLLLCEELKYSEDSNFIFRYLFNVSNVYVLEEKLYYYYIRNDSAIHQCFTHEWAESNMMACLNVLDGSTKQKDKIDLFKKVVRYYIIAYFIILFKMRHSDYDKERAKNKYLLFCETIRSRYDIKMALDSKWACIFFRFTKFLCCCRFFVDRLKHRILQ